MSKWFNRAAMATLFLSGCQPANQSDQAMPHPVNVTSAPAIAIPPIATPIITTAAATPTYRAFKDFVVGCGNTLHCTAVAARTDDQIGLTLVLQRDAGPAGMVSLKIANISGDPLDAASLMLDNKTSSILKLPWTGAMEGALELADATSIAHFVGLVKDSSNIRLGQDRTASCRWRDSRRPCCSSTMRRGDSIR